MDICDNWEEGSGLDKWDVDCNTQVEGMKMSKYLKHQQFLLRVELTSVRLRDD